MLADVERISARSLPPLSVRLQRVALVAALLAGFATLALVKAIPCAFARVFHVPCPGCGSTRSVLALLRGDVASALRYNAFGPVMALLIGILALEVVVSLARFGDLRNVAERGVGAVVKYGILVVAGCEIVLWVARFFGALGGPVPV